MVLTDPTPSNLETKIDDIFDKLLIMQATISELVTGRDQGRDEMQGAEVKLQDLEGRLEGHINWGEDIEEADGEEQGDEGDDGDEHQEEKAEESQPTGLNQATSEVRHRSKSRERTHIEGGSKESSLAGSAGALNAEPPKPTKVKFGAMPTASKFREWRELLRESVATASGRQDEAFIWIQEIEKVETVEDLTHSGCGSHGPWETPDSALLEALQPSRHGEIERQIKAKKEELEDQLNKPVSNSLTNI